jgi:hypothetical protein
VICRVGLSSQMSAPLNQLEIAIYDPHETINSTAAHCSCRIVSQTIVLARLLTNHNNNNYKFTIFNQEVYSKSSCLDLLGENEKKSLQKQLKGCEN